MLLLLADRSGLLPVDPGDYVNVDALAFLKECAADVPLLVTPAKSLLAISISGAEPERLFSRVGVVINPLRNSLGAEKEELFILGSYNKAKEWKAARLAKAGVPRKTTAEIVGTLFKRDELDISDDDA